MAHVMEKKWVQRSISLPVQECQSMPWKEFMLLLHQCWNHSTSLANWAAHTLRRHDVVRTPDMSRLPSLAPVDLYALAFGRAKEGRPRKADRPPLPVVQAEYTGGAFWAGAKIAAATLLRKIDRKYRRERGQIIWRRERRTPEYLYPYPFPVHQEAWIVSFGDQGQPLLNLALPGGRAQLRLRGGPEFARALKVLHEIVDGDLAQQELSLCRQLTGGTHRRQDTQRSPGGGHRNSCRVMVRIATRREVLDLGHVGQATLHTGADPFLRLVVAGEGRDFVLHAPWVRHWITEHRLFLRQFADDLKFEKRWPAEQRRNRNRYRERKCEKHARRMKTFLQQTAAQFVGHAVRRKVGLLMLDTSDRSFLRSGFSMDTETRRQLIAAVGHIDLIDAAFPWFALESCLQNKCDEAGITLEVVASGATAASEERSESDTSS